MPTGWPTAVLHWQALCPCVSAKAASWRTVVVGSFLAPQLRMRPSQVKSWRNLTRARWKRSQNQSRVRQVLIFILICLSTISQFPPHASFEGVTWAVWAWLCILYKHKLNLLARPLLSQQHSWTDEMLLPLFGCGTGGEHPFNLSATDQMFCRFERRTALDVTVFSGSKPRPLHVFLFMNKSPGSSREWTKNTLAGLASVTSPHFFPLGPAVVCDFGFICSAYAYCAWVQPPTLWDTHMHMHVQTHTVPDPQQEISLTSRATAVLKTGYENVS